MLTGRLSREYDDDTDGGGRLDSVQLFEATGTMTTPKRPVGRDIPTGEDQRCLTKIAAVAVLRRAGWSNERIAVALGWTDRHVRRRVSLIRQCAEATGRV